MRARSTFTALVALAAFVLTSFAAQAGDAGATAPPERPLLLVLELKLDNDTLNRQDAASLSGVVAVLAAEDPTFEVVAGEDLKRLLDLEAERQLMNCADDSCLAEISDALGADYVIFGSLGRLGANASVQLQVYDHANARPVARELVTMRTLDNAAEDLRPSVRKIVDEAKRDHATRHGDRPGSPSEEALDDTVPIALAAGGVAVIAGAALCTLVVLAGPALLVNENNPFPGSAGLVQDWSQTTVVDGIGGAGTQMGLIQLGVGIASAGASALALGAASYGVYALYFEGQE